MFYIENNQYNWKFTPKCEEKYPAWNTQITHAGVRSHPADICHGCAYVMACAQSKSTAILMSELSVSQGSPEFIKICQMTEMMRNFGSILFPDNENDT